MSAPGAEAGCAEGAPCEGGLAMDLLDLFDRGSAWAGSKVAGATGALDESTPCEDWSVRDLVNHMLHGNQLFAGATTGGSAAPPAGPPPELIGDDPAAQYEEARQ